MKKKIYILLLFIAINTSPLLSQFNNIEGIYQKDSIKITNAYKILKKNDLINAKSMLLSTIDSKLNKSLLQSKYSYLGYIYLKLKDNKNGINAFEKYLSYSDSVNIDFSVINNLVFLCNEEQQFTKSDTLIEKYLHLYPDSSKSYLFNNYAQTLFQRSKIIEGMIVIDSAIYYAKKYSEKKIISSINQNLAALFLDFGLQFQAQHYLSKSLEYSYSVNDTSEIANRYLDYATLYADIKDSYYDTFYENIDDSITKYENLWYSLNQDESSRYYNFKLIKHRKYQNIDSLEFYLNEAELSGLLQSDTELRDLKYSKLKLLEIKNLNDSALKVARNIYEDRKSSLFHKYEAIKFITDTSRNQYRKTKDLENFRNVFLEFVYFKNQARLADIEFKNKQDQIKLERETNAKELAKQGQNLAEAKLRNNLFIAGLILVVVIAVFLYRLTRVQKSKNAQLTKKNVFIDKQRNELREYNSEIKSSLRYARKIQETILPKRTKFDEYFSEHLILYYPKDEVSGDFYWTAEIAGDVYLALGDCTGHGTPAAILTMLGIRFLDSAILKIGLKSPDDILEYIDELFIETLKQENEKFRDGMEIVLIKIDNFKRMIQFAGAKRGILEISENNIIMHKGTLKEIGSQRKKSEYELKTIDLNKKSNYYIYSDGATDQQDQSHKKIGSKRFKKMMFEIANESMKTQEEILKSYYKENILATTQRDDIAIIGFKSKF